MAHPGPTQDQVNAFGRLLVYVTLPDGRDFGEVMLLEGLAREYTFRVPYQKQAQYLAAQGTAQASDRGLWGACAMLVDPAPAPLPPGGYFGPYDSFGVDRDCGDFSTWQDAQAIFEAAGGPTRDPHRLDADNDDIVCESLPGAP